MNGSACKSVWDPVNYENVGIEFPPTKWCLRFRVNKVLIGLLENSGCFSYLDNLNATDISKKLCVGEDP